MSFFLQLSLITKGRDLIGGLNNNKDRESAAINCLKNIPSLTSQFTNWWSLQVITCNLDSVIFKTITQINTWPGEGASWMRLQWSPSSSSNNIDTTQTHYITQFTTNWGVLSIILSMALKQKRNPQKSLINYDKPNFTRFLSIWKLISDTHLISHGNSSQNE